MTTIAVNRRGMAGDTLVDCDGTICHTDKIFRIGDSIVGVAGSNNYTTKFLAWFRKECPPDEVLMEPDDDKGGFLALVLNHEGIFLYTDCCEPDKIHDKHFAVGLGAQGACVAMDNGDTPAKAIRAVMKHSKATGGKIKELFLVDRHKKRSKTRFQPATPSEKEPDHGNPAPRQRDSTGSN